VRATDRMQVWKCTECGRERAYGMVVVPDENCQSAMLVCASCKKCTWHAYSHMGNADEHLFAKRARVYH
jgi:hypothetical protein